MATAIKEYTVLNGTSFIEGTSRKVQEALEKARMERARIRVYYGEVAGEESGRDWMEENDTIGYVGRSTGTSKIPLLVYNANTTGGGAILTDRIVKITTTAGRLLYQHPDYYQPEMSIVDDADFEGGIDPKYRFRVQTTDDVHACFETRAKAERWMDFIQGKRNSK